jgi:hypothetical protein
VNNTDYLLVSKHIAGTQLLPVNPPVVRTAASVKLPHPLINTNDANAIRQAAKFPLSGYTYFDTTKWVFSGIDAAHALNNITVGCSDVTVDIRGLCSGDVNGTYVPPAGYKVAEPGLELVNHGTLPLTDEIIFPIRVARDMEIGAITLYLDFDPSVMVVTDVTGVPELWFTVLEPTFNHKPETLNTLQIGWMSTDPIRVEQEGTVLLIHTRLTEAFRRSHFTFSDSQLTSGDLNVKRKMRNVKCDIRFALNDSILSEFADADGNVIGGLKLFIPVAGTNGETVKWKNGNILCYPNPARETLNIELETFNPEPETLKLEMLNIHATKVWKGEPETIGSGWHHFQLDLRDMAPGIYFLRATMNNEVMIKKVVISR